MRSTLFVRGFAIAVVISAVTSAKAQISPGPLSKAHAHLSGPTRCTECHDLAKRPPELKCLECHTDIRVRLDEHRGLHPSLTGKDRSGRTCAQCHSEHNGADFSLIHWDRPIKDFDHRRAGFLLEGRHATLPCRECHRPDRIPPTDAATLSVRDLRRTFLGLPRACSACHTDVHRGQFQAACDTCHVETTWKGAAKFRHETARFVLTGRHEEVLCERCHKRVSDEMPHIRYKGIEFGDCSSCHRDPHNGAFKFGCENCHTPNNWKASRISAVFNHSSTRYPLEGKHASLGCRSCHKENNFRQPVAFAKCRDCHVKDPHDGQFLRRADGGDCGACHTVGGFAPSLFTAQAHMQSRYPLAGRHAAVACAKCHLRRGEVVNYTIPDTRCVKCHSDVHEGDFRDSPTGGKCESCHTVEGFRPSTFTLSRHREARFPLDGGHFAVVCTDCHRANQEALNGGETEFRSPGRYHMADRSCTACHRDPHGGEFKARMAVLRPDGTAEGCLSCHVTETWHNLDKFDHSQTSFALEGTHRAVGCLECHKSATLRNSLSGVTFKSAPASCSGCHEDVHGGQFSRAGEAADCAACHLPAKWQLSTFDHETRSTFPLRGAHRAVRCASCHVRVGQDRDRGVARYKGTPHECAACHGVVVSRG